MNDPKIVLVRVFAGDDAEAKDIELNAADMCQDSGYEMIGTEVVAANDDDIDLATSQGIYP